LALLIVGDLIELFSATGRRDAKAVLADRLDERRRDYATTQLIHLPDCFWDTKQLRHFKISPARANFVGRSRVTGNVHVNPEPMSLAADDLVLLTAADPGYDWIFGRQIAGLITAYGGPNSHMAVRCAELGVPAAIGVGDTLFNTLRRAKRVDLDPSGETLRIIS